MLCYFVKVKKKTKRTELTPSNDEQNQKIFKLNTKKKKNLKENNKTIEQKQVFYTKLSRVRIDNCTYVFRSLYYFGFNQKLKIHCMYFRWRVWERAVVHVIVQRCCILVANRFPPLFWFSYLFLSVQRPTTANKMQNQRQKIFKNYNIQTTPTTILSAPKHMKRWPPSVVFSFVWQIQRFRSLTFFLENISKFFVLLWNFSLIFQLRYDVYRCVLLNCQNHFTERSWWHFILFFLCFSFDIISVER